VGTESSAWPMFLREVCAAEGQPGAHHCGTDRDGRWFFKLWSQDVTTGRLKASLPLQDEISQAATEAFATEVAGRQRPADCSGPFAARGPEAYQAYLQANYFVGAGDQSKEDLSKALALYRGPLSNSMRNMRPSGLAVVGADHDGARTVFDR